MHKMALFLIVFSTIPAFGDDVDWKLTFAEQKQETSKLLSRMEEKHFAKVGDDKVQQEITRVWRMHREEMLNFLHEHKPVYTKGNAKGECVQIKAGELQLSEDDCCNLSARALQRDLVRELFFSVAGVEDLLSRYASKALCDGWIANKHSIPSFSLVGRYHLKESKEGRWEIDVIITRDDNGDYHVAVDTLPSFQIDRLVFDKLVLVKGSQGHALATNPTRFSRTWKGITSKTFVGSESIEIEFDSPDKVSLFYTGRVFKVEWAEAISFAEEAFVRARETGSHFFEGKKVD